jgi:hypothetical protein
MNDRLSKKSVPPSLSKKGPTPREASPLRDTGPNDSEQAPGANPWPALLLRVDDLSHRGGGEVATGDVVENSDVLARADNRRDPRQRHIVAFLGVVQFPV